MNGLNISIDDFDSMSNKAQHKVLFQNQCKTMDLIKGYRFWYRMYTFITAAVLAGFIYLIKLHIGG